MDLAEFYITNTCNLACKSCNRFNNMNMRGREDWPHTRGLYQEWSSMVTPGEISVLGGEPLMHPRIVEILGDIRGFWPMSRMRVTTNGLLLDRVRDLRQCLDANDVWLDISCHNRQWRKGLIDKCPHLWQDKLEFRTHQDKHTKLIRFDGYLSGRRVCSVAMQAEHFHQNTINDPVEQGPYDSDREKAHAVCDMKYCHTFWQGKLYKCGVTAALPELIRQNNMVRSRCTQKQIDLIERYRPTTVEQARSMTQQQLDDVLLKSIEQCSLCPERYEFYNLDQKLSANYHL